MRHQYTLHAPSNDASEEGGSIAAKTCKVGTILKVSDIEETLRSMKSIETLIFLFLDKHVNLGVGHSLQ